MSDATLPPLLDEVRGKTLAVLSGVSESAARWTPPRLANHMLWHAGHCYFVLESLGVRALGKATELRDGWTDLFSWDSDPRTIAEDAWPRLAEVVAALNSQHQRVRELLRGISPGQLDAPVAHTPDWTQRFSRTHALHDEACHTGEIWLLRKMVTRQIDN